MEKKLKPTKTLITIIIVAIFLISSGLFCLISSLPVDKKDNKAIVVEIKRFESKTEIAKTLKEKNLIRNKLMFIISSKFSSNSNIQAGYYSLKKSMSLREILNTINKGSNYNPDNISITFKEGERLTDYVESIAENTDYTYEDIIEKINNKEYLNELINKYWFLTNSILNDDIYYPLEGYLSPNTYYFENKKVKLETIIEKLLDEEEKNLEKYKSKIESNHLNIHELITMASIAQLEGTNKENRKEIIGVFHNRLENGYNLGSDVTTYYGLQVPMNKDLTSSQFASVNPYNTRSNTMIGKYPAGPICNPEIESIEAAIDYNNNDYLFFVADKNGKIYFSKTNAEHDKKIVQIKEEGNWIW